MSLLGKTNHANFLKLVAEAEAAEAKEAAARAADYFSKCAVRLVTALGQLKRQVAAIVIVIVVAVVVLRAEIGNAVNNHKGLKRNPRHSQ